MNRYSIEQMSAILSQIKITNPTDAMKVLPIVINILDQMKLVMARAAKNEVLAASRERVFEKVKAGEMKPTTLPEPDEPVEETPPIEVPTDLPFEDDEVSEEEAEKARAELLGATEKPKKKTNKKK